jgi:energy-coupling factor transporter ATP-binding protein EcfA2
MPAELLAAILETHVLDPTPRGGDVVSYYVPFDDLLGQEAAETPLRAAVEAGRRVAVVGPSGAGKSSLIEWVLGIVPETFAAIRIPVAIEHDETVTDPRAFAQHVVRTVSKSALEAELISDEERRAALVGSSDRLVRPGREVSHRKSFGFQWLLKGDLGKEVRAQMEGVDQDRSAAQVVDALGYLINLLADHGLQAVFVIDDSDTWLSIEGVKDRSSLVNAFFDRVLRMLAELPCGLVVAVHDEYLEMPGYRQAEGFLETTIRVPRLTDEDQLAQLLLHRIRASVDNAAIGEAFAPEALTALMGYYSGAAGFSLRKVVQAAQTSVQLALDDGAGEVSESAVDVAASDWV